MSPDSGDRTSGGAGSLEPKSQAGVAETGRKLELSDVLWVRSSSQLEGLQLIILPIGLCFFTPVQLNAWFPFYFPLPLPHSPTPPLFPSLTPSLQHSGTLPLIIGSGTRTDT
ncbi:MAG: hypothetical protein LH628_14510 [Microcoleus sp. CAN_BIN18]|nr:hypothetical protein [Microcoleus sp. CAN_BIN18]